MATCEVQGITIGVCLYRCRLVSFNGLMRWDTSVYLLRALVALSVRWNMRRSRTTVQPTLYLQQVAQLSQTDRAAGWFSYGQKWKTGTGRQYLRISQIYIQPLRRIWLAKQSNSVKKHKQGYYAVQCHSRSSRSVPVESPFATSY